MKFTVGEIVRATGGTATMSSSEVVTGIATDSRKLKLGDAYVAIIGEHHDGHDFAEGAVCDGAALCIVSKPVDVPHILVEDTVLALGAIAKLHRESLNAKVIGITGSSGKTSTKDMLAQVLANFGETIAPPGSFNNEIGLPSTILRASKDTDYLVLEMGMRGLGHISYLCDIALPSVGAILNVGSAHAELLGGRENIALAKSEIVQQLPEDGTAVLYADDSLVLNSSQSTKACILTFGEGSFADVQISHLTLNEKAQPRFDVTYKDETQQVELKLVGEHQALNASAVIAVCLAVGLKFEEICNALNSISNISKWRMEVTELAGGITVVNDAYNANPESMRAGLKALKAMSEGRRTWAVLGEMRELGDDAAAAHDEIGRLIVRLDVNRLIAVGPGAKLIQMGASQEGSWGDEAAHVDTLEDALEILRNEVSPGDVVFFKASRAIGLERVAQAMIEHFTRENTHP
ncbi:MAG: UDP-N-acetylmuramoyl-tripeptide--D-alanyl-D-alanine ligase [Actinomycetota bacterium]